MIKRNFILITIIFVFGCAKKQKQSSNLQSKAIAAVIGQMSALMIHDITNPPLAARFFSYACLAGYEVVSQNDSAFSSMHTIVKDYPYIKKPDISDYDYPLAAILAMLETAKKIQPSGTKLSAYQNNLIDSCKRIGLSEKTIQHSQLYAQNISNAILAYAKADGYNKISALPIYTPLKGEQYWYPTPPGYFAAVEPYFTTVRTFFLDSSNQFAPPPPTPYSRNKNSAFYTLLYNNYKQNEESLSEEHRLIAAYWDCNPFAMQDGGHLMVGLKKISPGAHWLGITGIACRNAKKTFNQSMFIHALVSMGLMDSFIGCWNEKYNSNRVRPETAIRNIIDPNWKPLLQTPPFPEYLSGHSCISATSAIILTKYFGDNFAFTDTVEVQFGLPRRNFTSFKQAAEEAAVSRFYGGIHYMDAIDNGFVQGKKTGEWILSKTKMLF
jgi:hypothetical protein